MPLSKEKIKILSMGLLGWSVLMLANIYLCKLYPQLELIFTILAALVGAFTAFKLMKKNQ
ncbi:MAG: hypothetical protein ACKOWL_06570 [Sphingobacteriaceae bacterium]